VNTEQLKSKFIGALLGTFAGDALGMPVENWQAKRIRHTFGVLDRMHPANAGIRLYGKLFGIINDPARPFGGLPLGGGSYTDDTQMMIGVAESLIECRGFDGADMARRFAASFDASRGYGPGTIKAIHGLKRGIAWDKVGAQLFNNTGSFGNGAAMRVAPVALLYREDVAERRRVAELSSMITHAHPIGMEGAVAQAHAVAMAVDADPTAALDTRQFLSDLRTSLKPDIEILGGKLDVIASLLGQDPTVEEVVSALGNNTTVQGSFPAALYAFLRHFASFKEAVVYAVSLGGDTDTIGAICGAMAGAYHGVEGIPEEWMERLENGEKGRDYVVALGEKLCSLVKDGPG
jgi:ADP-ribosylglycohydrolase